MNTTILMAAAMLLGSSAHAFQFKSDALGALPDLRVPVAEKQAATAANWTALTLNTRFNVNTEIMAIETQHEISVLSCNSGIPPWTSDEVRLLIKPLEREQLPNKVHTRFSAKSDSEKRKAEVAKAGGQWLRELDCSGGVFSYVIIQYRDQ